ncbi:MAG: hypothetical protein GWM90_17590, partial [Gemmatimonadetes bacterium]|nr:hypothetical protein [Gemmatimonadota bacterium]NIQ56168.1 hypothetical protein [Gemmatimonadota bacterium]NIU76359.1 hypothetical protein [Gammaproteobacteria bacterium]NIX45839.1 hypothetical protein [Gemmatimonadota bacterium]NIY10145.1 hypothetical protein [Gemmatimonadota bacterium]
MSYERGGDVAPRNRRWVIALLGVLLGLTWVSEAHAQRVISQPSELISVPRGTSALLQPLQPVQRVLVGDPTIADYALVSPQELVINGIGVGTTSLFVWDRSDRVRLYTIAVTPD